MSSTRGRVMIVAAILLIAVALAAINALCHVLFVQQMAGADFALRDPGLARRLAQAFADTYRLNPEFFSFFAAAPLGAGVLSALVVGASRRRDDIAAEATETPTSPSPPTSSGALRLLALLQQEGRLIDFLEEDIEEYSDAQVGAAVRGIHSGCRNALHERMQIERIYAQEDGTAMELTPGFDPSLVRLTGNVHGEPPFRGTLQHGGWRVANVSLPETAEVDPTILAPAEVQID